MRRRGGQMVLKPGYVEELPLPTSRHQASSRYRLANRRQFQPSAPAYLRRGSKGLVFRLR